MARSLLAGSLCIGSLIAVACSKGFVKPPEVPDEVARSVGSVEAPKSQQLLLVPVGDAEGLLGREVQLSEGGGWTLADARAPGCEVRVKQEPSQYTRKHSADLRRLATLGAQYGELLGLQARYGASIEARFEVRNEQVLRADIAGTCGTHVVDSVLVGTGERSMVRRAEAGVSGQANIKGVPAKGEAGSDAEISGAVSWDTPQAYAFSYRKMDAATKPVHVHVELENLTSASTALQVTDGDVVALTVTTNVAAHIIGVYLTEGERGGVLWPSSDVPDTFVRADERHKFPEAKAFLNDPKTPVRETFVVYAFSDKKDFESFGPGSAIWTNEGKKYAEALTEKLSRIPMSRWGRSVITYTIEPKTTGQ